MWVVGRLQDPRGVPRKQGGFEDQGEKAEINLN